MTVPTAQALNTQLPAYLQTPQAQAAAAQAASLGAMFKSRAFPRISTAGNAFALVSADGEVAKVAFMDPQTGQLALDMVFILWNPNTVKTWYEATFADDSEQAPDCASSDGRTPDANVLKPQALSCGACQWNAFGSARNGKGKACSDGQRAAIMLAPMDNNGHTMVVTNNAQMWVPAGDKPYGYRLPPMTGKNIAARVAEMARAGVDIRAVVFRAHFVSQGVVDFRPMGFLSEALYKRAIELANSDGAERACGLDLSPSAPPPPPAPAYAAPPPAPAYAAPQPAPVAAAPLVHALTVQPAPAAPPQPVYAAPAAPPAPTPVYAAPAAPPAPVYAQPALQPVPQMGTGPAEAPKARKPRAPKAEVLPSGMTLAGLGAAPAPAPASTSPIQMPGGVDPALQALLDKAYAA